MELKLSDAYTVKEDEVSLELKAVMLNINPGHNEKILEACKTLREYTEYTSRVREYTRTMDLEAAVERAITECIQEGISEKQTEIIQKMLSMKEFSYEKIAEIVNLSVEEIREIESGNLLKAE